MRLRHRRPDRAATSGVAAMVALLVWVLAACTPTYDWRENRAPGTGLTTMFPCRPDRHARRVEVAGRKVEMQMLVCVAGGSTFAVSFYDAQDAAQVNAGLAALRIALLTNVADTQPLLQAARVKGMSPNPQAVQIGAKGRRPDGQPLMLRAAVFTRGLRVFQAAAVGTALTEDAAEPFFSGLRCSD